MSIEIRMLGPGEEAVLARVAPGVFDHPVDPALAREFLADPRHHIAVALSDGVVVGFASGVDYIHPDKPRELWINEVGTAPSHQRQGIGRQVVAALLGRGRALGCVNAWVLTEDENAAANALYASAGGKTMSSGMMGYEFMPL
ncbi:MAG: GNAT family N-acetyltransferase [Rhizomicrobium sp.]